MALSLKFCILAMAVVSLLGASPQSTWLINGLGKNGSVLLQHKGSTKRYESMCPGTWVPAWQAFAVSTMDFSLWRMSADGFIWPVDLSGPYSLAFHEWAVSPDGQHYASVYADAFESLEVTLSTIPYSGSYFTLRSAMLEQQFGQMKSYIALQGIAWSPSSRQLAFTHVFGQDPDLGGVGESQTALLNLDTMRLTDLGPGVPVAWIDETRLLMITDRSPGSHLGVWVRHLNPLSATRKTRMEPGVLAAGFSGRSIVLLRSREDHVLEEHWDLNLSKRIRVFRHQDIDPSHARFVIFARLAGY